MTKLKLTALTLAGCLLVPWIAPLPAAGETPESGSVDPVVAEVLEMLDAGVSDDLILHWLENTGRRPADVSAAAMIALSQAEASNTLVEALVTRAGEPQMEAEVVAAEVEEAVAEEVAAEEVERTESSGKPVEARFLIRAKYLFTDEPEPDSEPEEPWDVFVYLDGEYLGWVEPTLRAEPAEVMRVLPPGEHVLRVVLQRFDSKSKRFRYDALSVPVAVTFSATAGDPLEIDIEMKRIWGMWRDRSSGGPLSYRIKQGMEVLAEQQGTGGDPDRWRAVCEDIEANFPDAKKVPSSHRSTMASCLPWNDLWSDFGIETSRTEILEMLDSYKGAPPLRSF